MGAPNFFCENKLFESRNQAFLKNMAR